MITIPAIGFFLIGIVLILYGLYAIKHKWIGLGPNISMKHRYVFGIKTAGFFGSDWKHKGREAVIVGYVLVILGILFVATSILIFIS